MKKNAALSGIKIEATFINEKSINFCPPTWPVPDDYPVVIDMSDIVVSRFRDFVWDLTPWAGVTKKINFGPKSRSGRGKGIDAGNARIFQDIAAWWLWGREPARTASGLINRFDSLKPLFVCCSEENILATDLWKFPRVVEKLARQLTGQALSILIRIWLAREELGFIIADESVLAVISRLAKQRDSKQTPYIPPRIWEYQNLRARACLDDYIAHIEEIEECYRFCLDAYLKNCNGTFSERSIPAHVLPFLVDNFGKESRSGREYFGSFLTVAERFGIFDVLNKWTEVTNKKGIKCFASYLNLVSEVGLIYIMDCSFMRSYEAELLRSDCHTVEVDELGEEVHLIGGVTTKTINDPNAKWIASPSVSVAIDAMASIARLHISGAKHYPALKIDDNLIRNPYLLSSAYAPWSSTSLKKTSLRKRGTDYSQVMKRWPKFLEKEKLKISEADLTWAQRMTVKLDEKKIAVGKIWPLADHQLRRTGAVNMLGSEIVMESSIQYQLKHSSRVMTRYYCQNHFKLKSPLVDEAKTFFFQEALCSVVADFQSISSDSFVSPYGEKRKAQILNLISEKDARTLEKDARLGKISFRRNFFGGCAKQGEPCPLGGVSNVSLCMGYEENRPCLDVLVDKQRAQKIEALLNVLESKLADAPSGSDLHTAISYNIESTRRALDVIATGEWESK